MSTEFLNTPIEYLKGVGPKRADVLKKELKIFSFEDLLYYFPFRYVDRSKFFEIATISSDQSYIQVKGKMSGMHTVGTGRGKRLTASLRDGSGEIELVWFQGIKWIVDKIKPGVEYIVFGKPSYFKGKY
nr:ATP-dependent DNA helicase RecG [Bacteroidota bacterium]